MPADFSRDFYREVSMISPGYLLEVNMISSLSRSCTSSFARGNLSLLGQTVQKRNFFRIVDQYEKGVTFTLGKLTAVKDPGLRIAIPFIQWMWKADMRTTLKSLARQEVITKDNVTIKVDGVVQFRVIDPRKAICNVNGVGSWEKASDGDYHRVGVEKAINELAQLKIREVLSHSDVNEILRNREELGCKLTEGANSLLDDWGVEIQSIRIKEINFDESMSRAMAKTAEAQRVAEAKMINAQADIETAKKYEEAAEIYGKNPTGVYVNWKHLLD